MISDDVGVRLHDKATRGLPLSTEEQALLMAWYARQDEEESKELSSIATPPRLQFLREQVQVTLAQIVATAQHIQTLNGENEALRQEIAVLEQPLNPEGVLTAMPLPTEVIEQVRQRAKFACEYCGVTETDSAGRLTVDHYQPRARSGTDELGNLLYCCYRCNLYKSDYWPGQPDDLPLWNPRLEPRESHLLLLADGNLYAISPSGRFTLQRLHLNRPALVAYRLRQTVHSEEANILQQHQDLLLSLKSLHERLAETIEENHTLLRTHRAVITQFAKSNGQENGSGKPMN